jgi:uncharacterized protein involved in response to NO
MRNPPTIKSQDVFFPLAAGHAVVTIPLSVLAMTGATGWPPGLIGMAHGFEMFFGFALAVLAGYVLGQPTTRTVVLLVALWLGGRIFGIFTGSMLLGGALTIGFALVLGWHAVPRFRHAKKWRNQFLAWVLGSIMLMPLLWIILRSPNVLSTTQALPTVPLLLFALIMAFMGGRIIAPAAAGEFLRQGRHLEARVQPGMEGGIIALGSLAVLLLFVPAANLLAGAAAVAAGALLLVRLLRWRPWRCLARPDLVAMAVGYAWLAAGVMTSGFALIDGQPSALSVHLITIGALGTLSTTVMLNQVHQRWLKTPARAPVTYTVMPLIAIAAIARSVAVLQWEWRTPSLWLSAASWTIAYATVLGCLLWLPRTVRRRSADKLAVCNERIGR